ncbi:MAG: hypothetical protein A2202_06385 [Bdellovibrionales bacterium RIFOXYA1_FULL_36_14]|nr:MAG: hypothetical protein A2202_06385 [Bdellovibrionales bacterium RIFOXYA1_FULL_36_14]
MQNNKTLGKLLLEKVDRHPSNLALGWIEKNQILYYTFKEYFEVIETLALVLTDLGIEVQDKLTILSHTRKEWNFFDHATMSCRSIVVPIYPNYLSHEIKFIINHSDSKILVVENAEQFEKIIQIQNEIPKVRHIISIDSLETALINKMSNSNIQTHNYIQIMEKGRDLKIANNNIIRKMIESQEGSDIASIIYTSGTTGEPKGAVITQHAFASMLMNLFETLNYAFSSKDKTLVFLPTSHVLGRCDSMLNLAFGLCGVYAEGIDKVIDNINLAKPTVLLAVPRIFEKIYEKINQKVADGSSISRFIFNWAKKVSSDFFSLLDQDKQPSLFQNIKRKIAYALVFSKIYKRFGGKVRYFVSGGAPISREIILFLRNANLKILEGYGLTETIAPCVVNPAYKQIPGSVGLPLKGVEIKFAEDSEILIKTEAMFKGYFKNLEATDESLQNGWLHTGDIGRLNEQGYLVITDRKKDIIITSGGKNIASQPIENKMKLKKYITQFLVVGDRKNYLTGIVGIEKDSFKDEFPGLSIKDLAANSHVRELIRKDIEQVNKELARFETIKDFFIAPEEFSIENGTLTPSMKLKKKVILEKYKDEIDKLYNTIG